ncbi:MAG TPA: 4Fe-4S dicluster domain-containing protein [Chloroflexota bacterium]|nr:4Fe-4S dicluster domain-containing protein [Chloroflexota bacterium]
MAVDQKTFDLNARAPSSRVEEKLYNVRFKTDEAQSHLVITDAALCARCTDKPCTVFCPVSVYKWEPADRKISVGYEKCVECGACRIGCPYYNIEWRYPKGGFGVQYKNG